MDMASKKKSREARLEAKREAIKSQQGDVAEPAAVEAPKEEEKKEAK